MEKCTPFSQPQCRTPTGACERGGIYLLRGSQLTPTYPTTTPWAMAVYLGSRTSPIPHPSWSTYSVDSTWGDSPIPKQSTAVVHQQYRLYGFRMCTRSMTWGPGPPLIGPSK